MNTYRLKPMQHSWLPLVYGGAFLSAFLLQHQRLASLFTMPDGTLPVLFGIGLVLMAAGLDFWALNTMLNAHTTLRLDRCAQKLVTNGPYRFSRNPIYLSYTIALLGAGLILANAWLIIAAPMTALVTTFFAIKNEEMHLLMRFGVDFERYCQRTRRWL